MNPLTLHMGSDFDRLPDLVRAAHFGRVRLEGRVTARRGGPIARIICDVFRFPEEAAACRLIVESEHTQDRITWHRNFDGLDMESGFWREGNFLVERLGFLSMYFMAKEENGRLYYEFAHTRFLGIRLPNFISPSISAYEAQGPNGYQFGVLVSMPFLGEIIEYFGVMSIVSLQGHHKAKQTGTP